METDSRAVEQARRISPWDIDSDIPLFLWGTLTGTPDKAIEGSRAVPVCRTSPIASVRNSAGLFERKTR